MNFKKDLQKRLVSLGEWYTGAIRCPETLENIRRDTDYILREEMQKYGIERVPFSLEVGFVGDIVRIRAVDRKLS